MAPEVDEKRHRDRYCVLHNFNDPLTLSCKARDEIDTLNVVKNECKE